MCILSIKSAHTKKSLENLSNDPRNSLSLKIEIVLHPTHEERLAEFKHTIKKKKS